MIPRRSSQPRIGAGLSALLALVLSACGGVGEPRYAEVTVSADAPHATLSGSTRAAAPAIELSPGCPGYLDPGAPEHVVHLRDSTAVTITARSNRGPLALAVVGEGEVRCDSDGGAGHAPHVTIDRPGDYAVHVASLHQAEDLAYELVIAPAGLRPMGGPPVAARDERVPVSVTVTSDPPGATVRTPEGQVLGTTPAMFVVHASPDEMGTERRFVLELPGRPATEVRGRLNGGAVVLHAAIPSGPTSNAVAAATTPAIAATTRDVGPIGGLELLVSSSNAQPIRDHQVARQSVVVNDECTIVRAEVDVDIRHSFIGDLRVVLRSPNGTEVRLHDRNGGGRANLVTSFDWDARGGALRRLAGQSARGRWTMSVHDEASADSGTFRSFTLHLTCRESGAPRTAAAGSADPTSGAGAAPGGRTSSGSTRTRRQAPAAGQEVRDPWGSGPSTTLRTRPTPPVVTPTPPRPTPPAQAGGEVLDPWRRRSNN